MRLQRVKHFYNFLKAEGAIDKNPVRKVQLKPGVKKVVINPLEESELESLYISYEQLKQPAMEGKHALSASRNLVILGLMIWQGLHSGDLLHFERKCILLDKGEVYIPSTNRTNGRVLPLTVRQVLGLHRYMEMLPAGQVKLFDCNTRNAVFTIINEVKGLNPAIQNANHIRSSVILNWVRKYNKRQVQYMIGHKYITSTEHYEQQELTKLTSQLEKYHPLG